MKLTCQNSLGAMRLPDKGRPTGHDRRPTSSHPSGAIGGFIGIGQADEAIAGRRA